MDTWDESANPALEAARLEALRLVRSVELRRREIEMANPMGEPETVGVSLVGRYVRRSRLLAGLTQQQLADKAGVSQSAVSRVERGVGPAMELGRLVRLVQPLARFFPFGVCPHEHNCPWQPVRPPEEQTGDPTGLVGYFLGTRSAD